MDSVSTKKCGDVSLHLRSSILSREDMAFFLSLWLLCLRFATPIGVDGQQRQMGNATGELTFSATVVIPCLHSMHELPRGHLIRRLKEAFRFIGHEVRG